MTDADVLAFGGLSPRERSVLEMRVREGLQMTTIGERLGISMSQVNQALVLARRRARGQRKPARTARVKPMVMDADWWPRNVAYVRSLAHSPDPTHQQRYLNGITLVWGREVADEVERRASA